MILVGDDEARHGHPVQTAAGSLHHFYPAQRQIHAPIVKGAPDLIDQLAAMHQKEDAIALIGRTFGCLSCDTRLTATARQHDARPSGTFPIGCAYPFEQLGLIGSQL